MYRATEPFLASDGHTRLIFQWFSLEKLDRVTLYPPFLVKGLLNLPEYPVDLVESHRA